jgi:hypothetical protein
MARQRIGRARWVGFTFGDFGKVAESHGMLLANVFPYGRERFLTLFESIPFQLIKSYGGD